MGSSASKQQHKEKASPEGIQVICAGLGRTGTLSLTEALKRLGYKPYHYLDVSHSAAWCQVAETQGKDARAIETVLTKIEQDGYTATLENPTSDIYQDILAKYPNAKVVLTVRDSPQAFVKSWKLLFDTMVVTEQTFSWTFPSFLGYIPLFRDLKKIRHFMGTTHLGLEPGALTHGWRDRGDNSDEWLAEQYERHNQHIMDHVPKDQLLVFNVKQGWEPLCEFLGKEVPPKDEPFPHCQINNAASLKALKKQFVWVVYGWIPVLVLSTAAVVVWSSQERPRGKGTV
ncbi:expressed unknown protein [Seminavis robusta]|uniref:NAD dependent epimerase/dehydratase n=1 Tax=Seminavis robusta TaxID=568900 RepID=A0A9N8DJ35_9STRA|nr:expressed unknown protein [Seminavis robusta]|eukprot:Sro171_g075750.1 n/a (286) ;mRNA; f:42252-43109